MTPAAAVAEACTPPSNRCVPPEIVRSRATDARVDCVIIRPIAATVRFIFMRRGSVGFFNGIASRLRIGLTTFFFRVATRRSRRHGKSPALRARHDCSFQPTRVFKSRVLSTRRRRAVRLPSGLRVLFSQLLFCLVHVTQSSCPLKDAQAFQLVLRSSM